MYVLVVKVSGMLMFLALFPSRIHHGSSDDVTAVRA